MRDKIGGLLRKVGLKCAEAEKLVEISKDKIDDNYSKLINEKKLREEIQLLKKRLID